MAKSKMPKPKKTMTTEQKIMKYQKQARRRMIIRTVTVVLVMAIAIPTFYYGYYFAVFDHMLLPSSNSDTEKVRGVGYSRPLLAIDTDSTAHFTFAYYSGGKWHVVDDDEVLRENRESFLIYTLNETVRENSIHRLCLYRENSRIMFVSLDSLTFIDNRCLEGKEKLMNTDEFKQYAKQRGLFVEDIGD